MTNRENYTTGSGLPAATCYTQKTREYQVKPYKNRTTIKGRVPVKMRMRKWVLYTTIENISGRPRGLALEWSKTLSSDITYRPLKGDFGTRDLELWIPKHNTKEQPTALTHGATENNL